MNVFFLPGPVHLVAKTQDLIVHFQDQLVVLLVVKTLDLASNFRTCPPASSSPRPWT